MTTIDPTMPLKELLQIVADNHTEKIQLSDEEKENAIAILKSRAIEELDYGEELKVGKVRLIKRVTGAVGLYFK